MAEIETMKQKKLLKLIMEYYGKVGSTKSMGELMIEAGYSPESAKNPKLILEGEFLQEKLSDWAKMLDDKRRMAITHLTEDKLKKANARDLAQVATTLTRDYQLATGGATENVKTYEFKIGDNSSVRSEELGDTASQQQE